MVFLAQRFRGLEYLYALRDGFVIWGVLLSYPALHTALRF